MQRLKENTEKKTGSVLEPAWEEKVWETKANMGEVGRTRIKDGRMDMEQAEWSFSDRV